MLIKPFVNQTEVTDLIKQCNYQIGVYFGYYYYVKVGK